MRFVVFQFISNSSLAIVMSMSEFVLVSICVFLSHDKQLYIFSKQDTFELHINVFKLSASLTGILIPKKTNDLKKQYPKSNRWNHETNSNKRTSLRFSRFLLHVYLYVLSLFLDNVELICTIIFWDLQHSINFHYNNNFNIFGIVVKSSINAVLQSNFRCSTESILVIISHIHLQLHFLFKTCNNREGNLPVYCVKNSCWTDKKMCLLIITMIKCHSNIGFAGIIQLTYICFSCFDGRFSIWLSK